MHPPHPGMHQISASDSISSQVEILNKQMERIMSANGSNPVHAVQAAETCQVCGLNDHPTIASAVISSQ